MSAYEDELAARAARARDVALFRYSVIRAAADPGLPPRQRGLLVRELAAGQHKDPAGQPVSIGRSTLDRWIRLWAAGGFDALVPGGRQVAPRTGAGVLELAVALKKEKPERTAAQVTRVLAARLAAGQVPSVRTIQRHFVRMDLAGPAGTGTVSDRFGRFEAAAPGELWVSDVLHGPPAATPPRRTCSASRMIIPGSSPGTGGPPGRTPRGCSPRCGGRWRRTAPRRRSTLITAARTCPGSCCTPSPSWASPSPTPGPAAPRGKAKSNVCSRQSGRSSWSRSPRAGRPGTPVQSVTALEELFGAWVHQVYHRAVHSETGQAPAERFAAAPSRLRRLAPRVIEEAFWWQDFRTVTKTATVSLHGNRYQVDPALSGRKVELLYNPADLTGGIRVRWRGTTWARRSRT